MDSHVLDNFNRLAQTDQNSLPVHQTLAHLLGHVGSRPIARLRTLLVRRILRMRVLDDDRVQDHYVVGVDGTGMYSFKTRHCPYCLTQKHGGVTSYFHPVLEAKILTRAGLALSVGSEFIENLVPRGLAQDPNYPEVKQDCELKAFARMAPQIRRDFPQLSMAITSDALYACGTAIQLCKDHGMGYIFTFKPGSLPAVWEEFQALLRECPENTRSVTLPSGTVQIYRWVNQISYQDSAGRHHTFDAFLCQETTPDGLSTLFAWITHFHVTRENVVLLSEKGGRVRTVIENQGFNVQKNSGLNLEHVYGISDTNRKAFYYLLQIAHILLQFFERGSLLKQIAAQQGKTVLQLFGSLKNIARRLLECFRYFLIPQDAYDATLAARIQIRLNSS